MEDFSDLMGESFGGDEGDLLLEIFAMAIPTDLPKRQLYYLHVLDDPTITPTYPETGNYKLVDEPTEANLISSHTSNGKHAPAIDIDLPCRLVPSKTPGKFHLYIDVEIEWTMYLLMLKAMALTGIVEPGFVKVAEQRGHTMLRTAALDKYEDAQMAIRDCLQAISEMKIPTLNPDGEDQAAETMQLFAQETLKTYARYLGIEEGGMLWYEPTTPDPKDG